MSSPGPAGAGAGAGAGVVIKLEGKAVGDTRVGVSAQHIISSLAESFKLPEESLYALQNGKICDIVQNEAPVNICFRVLGGKGGFGSMLRAIGAQIEKTTNREACRDLSGRRLRDIREEQRLRNWAAAQPQREEEARRRKEEKLKRYNQKMLCPEPKHEFNDPEYEAARRNMEESAAAAIEAGTKAVQLEPKEKSKPMKRKRPKLWIDDEISDSSSSESGCEDDKSDDQEPSTSSAALSAPTPVTSKGKGIGKKSRMESPIPESVNAVEPDSGNESDNRVFS